MGAVGKTAVRHERLNIDKIGFQFTRLHILLYTIMLIIITLLPYLTGMSVLIYLATALVLGAHVVTVAFPVLAVWRVGDDGAARAPRQQQIERINTALARESVQQVLVDLGVAPEDASARVQLLSDAELQTLDQKLAELPAGGVGFVEVVGIDQFADRPRDLVPGERDLHPVDLGGIEQSIDVGLQAEDRKALIPYIMTGDPHPDVTVPLTIVVAAEGEEEAVPELEPAQEPEPEQD